MISDIMDHLYSPYRAPVALVTSHVAWERIKLFEPLPVSEPKPGEVVFTGTPIYHFGDVPKNEVTVFYDREVLNRYAILRQKIGHAAALKRLTADGDGDLIRTAIIRALLETT